MTPAEWEAAEAEFPPAHPRSRPITALETELIVKGCRVASGLNAFDTQRRLHFAIVAYLTNVANETKSGPAEALLREPLESFANDPNDLDDREDPYGRATRIALDGLDLYLTQVAPMDTLRERTRRLRTIAREAAESYRPQTGRRGNRPRADLIIALLGIVGETEQRPTAFVRKVFEMASQRGLRWLDFVPDQTDADRRRCASEFRALAAHDAYAVRDMINGVRGRKDL